MRRILRMAVVAVVLNGFGATAFAGVVTGDSGIGPTDSTSSATGSGSADNNPQSVLNMALGGGGSSSTAQTTSAPAETPAQKAAILAQEKKMEEQEARREARLEKERQQERESLNGMSGPYFLPPLPAPSYVRPMVGTQYQEQFPLSTKEIQWIKNQMEQDQYAMHKGAPLTIVNPSLSVDLGPGSPVPTIYVAPGYVTTISVVGEDGTPWPVTSHKVGGGNAFVVSAAAEYTGVPNSQPPHFVSSKTASSTRPQPVLLPKNLLTLSPKYFGSSSNLVLTLQGLSTPLMVNVIAVGPNSKKVDGMVTLRVDRHGPDAPPPIYMPPPPSAVSSDLLLFLSQTPPKGAVGLHVSGGYGIRAWDWNRQVVVRTRIPLLSPAWTSEVRQDGVYVYAMPKTRILMLRYDRNVAQGTWQERTVFLSHESRLTPVSTR